MSFSFSRISSNLPTFYLFSGEVVRPDVAFVDLRCISYFAAAALSEPLSAILLSSGMDFIVKSFFDCAIMTPPSISY